MVAVKLNQDGYTLIEAILMLLIVMVITSAVIYGANDKIEELEEKRFLHQFHLNLQQAQSIAIGNQQLITLAFDENRTSYSVKQSGTILLECRLPSHMSLSIDSYLKGLRFQTNGSVNQFGKFSFLTKKGTKIVTVHIGSGRVSYEL